MKGRNDFLLPDELGWECNDEISKYMDKWFNQLISHAKEILQSDTVGMYALFQISKAEIMDNIYAIIKKYQTKEKK